MAPMDANEDEAGFQSQQEDLKLPELKLDAKQVSGFITFYKRLAEDSKVVRFFDRKDCYTVHGMNATFIAQAYYKSLTALRQLGSGSNTITGISINRSMFETILRDLLLERREHSVELYEGSGSNWNLAKVATPGRLSSFEDILFATNEMQESPVIMALHLTTKDNERSVGIAFVDMTRRTLGINEFVDDEKFSNLESAIIALGCRECMVPQDSGKSPDTRKLRDVFARCDVFLTEAKSSGFRSRDLQQDLGRLVKGPVDEYKELLASYEGASPALAALLGYTDILGDETNLGKYAFQPYSLDTYMRLDAAALRALNALENKTDANKNFSLFGLMNRTCSVGMGKRLLNRWLKQPLLDVREIEERLDIVSAFVESAATRQDLRQHLRRIPDIGRLSRKVETRRANLQDIVKLYQAGVRLPSIRDTLKQYEGQYSLLLQERYTKIFEEWTGPEHLQKFDNLVEAAVDLDQLQHGEYIIAAGYDSNLGEIRSERDHIEEQIQKIYQQAGNDLDLPLEKALKLDKSTQWGHVFRITKKEEPKVRKKLTGSNYVTLETRKDGVKFTNTRLRRCSEHYSRLCEEYVRMQRELVSKVVEVAATFSEVFEGVAALLAEMDVLLSFADLAASSPRRYVRPIITPSNQGDIILQGSRHPCVEAQDDVNFIPNDCCLVRDKSWFQIITGPNMGGKSTYIRQVGVNVLMAQVGCFLPCDHAEISVRDCIFARVGAGDSQGAQLQYVLIVDQCIPNYEYRELYCKTSPGCALSEGPFSSTKEVFMKTWVPQFINFDDSLSGVPITAKVCLNLMTTFKLQGVSTFMAEMLETATILKSATERSLIIIDELGRGTSTYDGFGLAWAICEHLVEVTRAPCLFATHFHELTALAEQQISQALGPLRGLHVGISNFHVTAHIDSKSRRLSMLYKVEKGPCDQSFGIHVAEFAHFPKTVLTQARQKAAELEDFSPLGLFTEQGEGQVGAKRKRRVSGDDGAREFLKRFSSLPLDQLDFETAKNEISILKTQFLANVMTTLG